MCTVTWQSTGAGSYELHFNRDELRTRRPGLPPTVQSKEGTRFVAPRDADAGGTWIAANEHGLTMCLLNNYEAPEPQHEVDFVSRGHLVASLTSERDPLSALSGFTPGDLALYRPFVLLGVDSQEARALAWDGTSAQHTGPKFEPLLCSSSADPVPVFAMRRRLLETMHSQTPPGRTLDLGAFHRSHQPLQGAFSPCMHRTEATTVSYCRVEVTPALVAMSYAAGSPCETQLQEPVTLERCREPASV